MESGREYRVNGAMRHGRWRTPIGRIAELREITRIVTADEPRTVVVAGPLGIGRTCLARAVIETAGARGKPTRWAAGTKAAAGIPLGALAHLLPSVDSQHGPLALLQAAMTELREAEWARHGVIAIDDAHLLDEVSATLVHQIAVSGSTAMVVTVRSGERMPDPISALWKDGLAIRLDLKPLRRTDLEAVAADILGGPVDARTGTKLWRATGGNPLFLRELVELGKETGSLRRSGEVWHWDGRVIPTPRLTEIVRTQLGELDPAEQATLELLATAGPLDVELLIPPAKEEAVIGLERRGLVRVEHDGRRTVAAIAQPLHAEVLRAHIPEGTARRLRRELVAAATRDNRWDVLRIGSMLLDSDGPDTDPDLLTQAAEHANRQLRHDLAERLATAAVNAGAGVAARLAVLEAAHWKGRNEQAEQFAVSLASLTQSDEERARLAVLHASVLYLGQGRETEAEAVLHDAEAAVHCQAARARLIATRGMLAFVAGRPCDAVKYAQIAEAVSGGDPFADQCAAAALAAGYAVLGRTSEALCAAKEGWSLIESHEASTETAFARLLLAHGELTALRYGGRIDKLRERAGELHAQCMEAAEWFGDAIAALHVGWAALTAGQPRTAVRWLTDAAAGLDRADPCRLRPLCIALLARAHAQFGDADTATELLSSLRNHSALHPVFEPERLIAEAWTAAAAGSRSEGAHYAMRAASAAADRELWSVEASALHLACRMGKADAVAARLRELTGQIDGDLVTAYAEHASALAAVNGDQLDVVAETFARLGAMLLAADAAAEAACAHARGGDRRRAAASANRAVELSGQCEGAQTPALSQLAPPRLTPREAEIAELAARGMYNKAIAKCLVLSVRTVEAHLANIYTKLGISSRKQLRDALAQRMPVTCPAPSGLPEQRSRSCVPSRSQSEGRATVDS